MLEAAALIFGGWKSNFNNNDDNPYINREVGITSTQKIKNFLDLTMGKMRAIPIVNFKIRL